MEALGAGREEELAADEAVLSRAWQRLQALTIQLEVAPFTRRTTQELLRYVREDAEPARAAFARWSTSSAENSALLGVRP